MSQVELEDLDDDGLVQMQGSSTMGKSKKTQGRVQRGILFGIGAVIILCTIMMIIIWSLGFRHATGSTTMGSHELERLIEESWQQFIMSDIETATLLGEATVTNVWSNRSLAAITEDKDYKVELLAKLKKLDNSSFTSDEQLNLDLMIWIAEDTIQSFDFQDHLLPISQMYGPQILFPQLLGAMDFTKNGTYENYLGKMNTFPLYIDQNIELMKLGMKEGISQPREAIGTVQHMLESLTVSKAEDSLFFLPFKKLAQNDPIRKSGHDAIEHSVIPAYKKLLNYWQNEYYPNCRNTSIGLSALPNGKAWYEYKARSSTTTTLTPQEVSSNRKVFIDYESQIHDIGWSEFNRIKGEMMKVINETHVEGVEPNIQSYSEYFRSDPQFILSTEEELLRLVRDVAKRVDPLLPTLFNKLPRCPYGVLPIPAHEAPGAPIAYYIPPSDGCQRAGYYFINTYDLPSRPMCSLPSVTLHEAISIQEEIENVPKFRKYAIYNAFVEGWALYSEYLGESLGFYDTPCYKFGRLGDEMLRACRLLVDTGIHSLNWTKQQSIDLMKGVLPLSDLDIVTEVNRYIVMPGQALGYKIGELKIKELRNIASKKANFDLKKFHDSLLGRGSLPLDIVERIILDEYSSTR